MVGWKPVATSQTTKGLSKNKVCPNLRGLADLAGFFRHLLINSDY
jgi:hypothetical protein